MGARKPSEKPRRIQRKRTKGWKMPPNTVYVGRPTKYGNRHDWRDWLSEWPFVGKESGQVDRDEWCRDQAAQAFNEDIEEGLIPGLSDLRGKNLACWCPADMPCHADVLLEIANAD